jgi:hypothetical protein
MFLRFFNFGLELGNLGTQAFDSFFAMSLLLLPASSFLLGQLMRRHWYWRKLRASLFALGFTCQIIFYLALCILAYRLIFSVYAWLVAKAFMWRSLITFLILLFQVWQWLTRVLSDVFASMGVRIFSSH